LRRAEKKSFLTIFSIILFILILFGGFIFYLYYEENRDSLENSILFRMKNYTFDFKSKEFKLVVEKKQKEINFSNIFDCNGGLCSYFKFPNDEKYILKVVYPKYEFEKDKHMLLYNIAKLAFIAFLFMVFFSLFLSFYSLRPMKNALRLLEVFLKDLIHDLNTPVTSILLNVKLLEKKEKSQELERIELSANTISSLYKNLKMLNANQTLTGEAANVEVVVSQRVQILQKLYPHINFVQDLRPLHVEVNENVISRIIDNVLSNACKYNKKNGKIFICILDKTITIRDTGIGIKNPEMIFERYYKENERGLGIGMNIVKKLCDEFDIKIIIESKINIGTTIKLTLN